MIISTYKMNKNSFSNSIVVNPTVIHNIIKGRNAPGFDLINKIALSFDNIDMNWLITGKGEMLRNKECIDKEEIIAGAEKPPGCELCKAKDEVITSLKAQINTQTEMIELLKEVSLESVGQKRKVS